MKLSELIKELQTAGEMAAKQNEAGFDPEVYIRYPSGHNDGVPQMQCDSADKFHLSLKNRRQILIEYLG